MLKRKIQTTLENWKKREHHKAFLLKGARQVGKTTSIREFAKSNYECFIEINFERTPSYTKIFDGNLDADTILLNISAIGLENFVEGSTIIFFDEIQKCPNARTAIKFLVEDGRFDYIESGSLLGLNFADVSSYPVGFEEHVEMYSLDFEEFLWGLNVPETTITNLLERFQKEEQVPTFLHEQMIRNFREYMIVGGMPQVVNTFLQTRDIQEVIRVQKNIIASYRDDISKYAQAMKAKTKEVFDAIPDQLNKKNNRFYFSKLEKEPTLRAYEGAITWLKDAGIAKMCCNVSAPVIPLSFNEKRNIFKLYVCDTGLLSAMSYEGIQNELLNGDLYTNEGAIVENIIADILIKKGKNLHYYDTKKPIQMEIDFLLQRKDQLLPIKVKSGKDYQSHASIQRLLQEHTNMKDGLILCVNNIKRKGNILYAPLYMAIFL